MDNHLRYCVTFARRWNTTWQFCRVVAYLSLCVWADIIALWTILPSPLLVTSQARSIAFIGVLRNSTYSAVTPWLIIAEWFTHEVRTSSKFAYSRKIIGFVHFCCFKPHRPIETVFARAFAHLNLYLYTFLFSFVYLCLAFAAGATVYPFTFCMIVTRTLYLLIIDLILQGSDQGATKQYICSSFSGSREICKKIVVYAPTFTKVQCIMSLGLVDSLYRFEKFILTCFLLVTGILDWTR